MAPNDTQTLPDDGDHTDRHLVLRIHDSDEIALHDLLLRYYEPLTLFVTRYVYSIDVAEDVVQSLFIRLWDRRGHWNVTSSTVRVYLFSAARNAARDALAATDARSRAEQRSDIPSNQSSPEELFENTELQQRVARAVELLPDRCREIYLLARDHGMRFVDIAEVLGIAPSTVRTQMGRALVILQKEIGPYLATALLFAVP